MLAAKGFQETARVDYSPGDKKSIVLAGLYLIELIAVCTNKAPRLQKRKTQQKYFNIRNKHLFRLRVLLT